MADDDKVVILDDPPELQQKKPGRPPKPKEQPLLPKRPRGRPKKDDPLNIFTATNEQDAQAEISKLPPLYKCTRCGYITPKPEGKFYKIKTYSPYSENGGYCAICINCTKALFQELKMRHGDERCALIMLCSCTGHYYSETKYNQMCTRGTFTISGYLSFMSSANMEKNFITYLVECMETSKAFMASYDDVEKKKVLWNKADRQNKEYCDQTLGFDAFTDEVYTESDKKFLYNTLASYLTEDVVEDPHKLNSAVALVKTIWQVDKMSKMVNVSMQSQTTAENNGQLTNLIRSKVALQSEVNNIAKANGLSAEGAGKGRAANLTITGIMKAMQKDGWSDIKPNLFDAQMDEAYRKVAEQNARALMNELNYTTDEYAKMLSEQNETVRQQAEKIAQLEEEKRLLSVETEQAKREAKDVVAKAKAEVEELRRVYEPVNIEKMVAKEEEE